MRAEFATPGFAGLDISGEHFRPENHLGKPGDEHLPLCGDQDRVIGEPGRSRPYAGVPVSAGGGTSAVAYGLRSGHTYKVVADTVDEYGNVSRPVELSVTA